MGERPAVRDDRVALAVLRGVGGRAWRRLCDQAARRVGEDLRPRGRVVGAGPARPRDGRRSTGPGGGRVRRRPVSGRWGAGDDGGVAGGLRRYAVGTPRDAAGVRATHRGGPPRARLRLGPDHRAEGRRRDSVVIHEIDSVLDARPAQGETPGVGQPGGARSEERRVGKEWRWRWGGYK